MRRWSLILGVAVVVLSGSLAVLHIVKLDSEVAALNIKLRQLDESREALTRAVAIVQNSTSPCIPFSIVPTVVSTKVMAIGDPGPTEKPLWKTEIDYPRLASVLTLAFLGTEWSRGERLTSLPEEILRPISEHPLRDPHPEKYQWESLWLLYERAPMVLSVVPNEQQIAIDELFLFSRNSESKCDLYIRQGSTWWAYPTAVEHGDLKEYARFLSDYPF